jgi:hypothetical protein
VFFVVNKITNYMAHSPTACVSKQVGLSLTGVHAPVSFLFVSGEEHEQAFT